MGRRDHVGYTDHMNGSYFGLVVRITIFFSVKFQPLSTDSGDDGDQVFTVTAKGLFRGLFIIVGTKRRDYIGNFD